MARLLTKLVYGWAARATARQMRALGWPEAAHYEAIAEALCS